jgi:sarcosine oxidase gamma subunit
MSAKTPYTLVLAEQKYLAGAKGVRAATLRRLSPGGWVIGVATSETIEKVAQIAKKPPAADSSAAVKIADNIVEVTLSGSP